MVQDRDAGRRLGLDDLGAQIICNEPTHSCRGLHALPLHQRHTPQSLCSKA